MSEAQQENGGSRQTGGEMEMLRAGAETEAGVAKMAAGICSRPWAFTLVRFMKKSRTKVALALVAWCLAEGIYSHERPFDLRAPNAWVVLGLLFIVGGLALRLAALGCIRKKEQLAVDGVYSICRHPLYLGSILLAYGFCALLGDVENLVLATVYFLAFYPITILWEEKRLAAFYGEAHSLYRARTPMLLPLGAFRAGAFTWRAAMSKGGVLLLAAVGTLIASVQVMAAVM